MNEKFVYASGVSYDFSEVLCKEVVPDNRELKDYKFSDLEGRTITEILGCEVNSDEITIRTSDSLTFILYHDQECCEHVAIEDVNGDVKDMIGSPIIIAEEATNGDCDSTTWTFYKLATVKGFLDIRWCGNSNGYYSESVDLRVSGDLKK
jgi:hypothetical protein